MAEALGLTARQRRERVRWSKGRKQRFLAALAETCDVEEACAAADLDWIGICQLWATDPQFAADWEAVIAAQYARVETVLLKEAGAAGGAANVALARELLKLRPGLAAARGGGGRAKPSPVRTSPDTSMNALMAKLAKLQGGSQYDRRNDAVAKLAAGDRGQCGRDRALPQPPARGTGDAAPALGGPRP